MKFDRPSTETWDFGTPMHAAAKGGHCSLLVCQAAMHFPSRKYPVQWLRNVDASGIRWLMLQPRYSSTPIFRATGRPRAVARSRRAAWPTPRASTPSLSSRTCPTTSSCGGARRAFRPTYSRAPARVSAGVGVYNVDLDQTLGVTTTTTSLGDLRTRSKCMLHHPRAVFPTDEPSALSPTHPHQLLRPTI